MLIDLSLPVAAADQAGAEGRDAALARLGHAGTHLDKVLGTTVPLEYFRSRGLLFDVRGREGEVGVGDIPLDLAQPGDFILFRTGLLAEHGYASAAYMKAPFALAWELIAALERLRVRFIGVDARGLRNGAEHRQADERCERAGIYVVENMNNLDQLPATTAFTAHAAWFDFGGTGIPCRVLAETA
jgi:kynurenine formamidase